MRILRIALAQIDVTVGDLDGNVEKIIEALWPWVTMRVWCER
jgi:hypothetical protein